VTLALSCLLLIAFRQTDLLISPRLWAEEGKVFYLFARHHSFWEAVSTPQVGYLTLFNAIVSTLQARLFPVESAATVTTYAGFLVQLVPIYLVVFSSHAFWDTPLQKIVCVLIIVLATPPELWLNTTNSHFIFGLITFLIMVIPAGELSSGNKWLFRSLLAIGNLTGPASMLLTPVFLLKAHAERSREKYLQAAIQSCCSLVQAAVTIHSLLYANPYRRLEQIDSGRTVFGFFVDHFSLNIMGFGPTWYPVVGFLVAIYFVVLFVQRRKESEYLIFMLSFVFVAVFSTAGSLGMLGSPRYGYVPTCILLFLISAEAFRSPATGEARLGRRFAVALLSCSLAFSAIFLRTHMGEVHSPGDPAWTDEVAKWRADPGYRPKITPGGWELDL
jgi:hypothetical protein